MVLVAGGTGGWVLLHDPAVGRRDCDEIGDETDTGNVEGQESAKEHDMTTETRNGGITVMDPRAGALDANAELAPRPGKLDGKVLGLLSNGKLNAAELLQMVGGMLGEQFELKYVKEANKPDASRPAPEDTVAELARESDFAVVAIGD